MPGKGLVFTVSLVLYDAAVVDEFVTIDDISEFLDEQRSDVFTTMQVLHNIMVAVTEQEYFKTMAEILTKLDNLEFSLRKISSRSTALGSGNRYTLNPIVYSLIEKGIGSTPLYQALKIVVSELLRQWEDAADKGKLTEFTDKISADHREGLVTEICRRVALKNCCELSEEELESLREIPRAIDRFKKIAATKFVKAFETGKRLKVNITPSDVISYISAQLRKADFPR